MWLLVLNFYIGGELLVDLGDLELEEETHLLELGNFVGVFLDHLHGVGVDLVSRNKL